MYFGKKYENPSPEIKTNIFSKLFFCWLFPLFKNGYKNDLEIKDLYNISNYDESERLGNALERNWNQEQIYAKETKRRPELRRAIIKTFLKPYSILGIQFLFQTIILKMMEPLVIRSFIGYFDSTSIIPAYQGWLLATGVVLISLLFVTIAHYVDFGQSRIGMHCRIAACSLIYRKILRLNAASVKNTTPGQIINLLSNDVARFDEVPKFLHYIWIAPIQTVIATVFMYYSIGYAALPGVMVIIIQAVPLQGYLSYLQGKLRLKIAKRTDYRVQLMSEITKGIKVIKMYAWEKPFEKLVAVARKLEIDEITVTYYFRAVFIILTNAQKFAFFIIVVTYHLLGEVMSSAKLFSIAIFLYTVQFYMGMGFPVAITLYAETNGSIRRIEEFLLFEEDNIDEQLTNEVSVNNPNTIRIVNANANWLLNPIVNTLRNINVEIKHGSLCAIVGPVGAGKTSLLQLLLKELPLSCGKLEINGNISYASQEPWLFTSTVRNNILFGLPYFDSKYKETVNVCALDKDLELFPNGDRTLVGERGVSLSGGQRARINLARAVYREADIYLFDDPLSAVDTQVAKHLFEECVVKYLGGKTRILVTHQLQFLERTDQIIIINNGQVEHVGTYNELSDKILTCIHYEEPSVENMVKQESVEHPTLIKSNEIMDEEGDEPEETHELIEKGSIPVSLYTEYFRKGGSLALLVLCIMVVIISQIICNASDLWVNTWINVEEQRNVQNLTLTTLSQLNTTGAQTVNNTVLINEVDDSHSSATYIYIYTGLILMAFATTAFRTWLFFKICMNASRGVHDNMFSNVLKAPMRFFDTNPSGRILNRFSKDMGTVDELLPKAFMDVISITMNMLGILGMVFIVTPWMIIPSIMLIILFVGIRKIYLASAQNIRRLEGITRAPAFSHVTASLSGLTTIRASGAQQLITNEFDNLQDRHTSALFLSIATSEAFGFYMDLLNVAFIAVLAFQFLIFHNVSALLGSDANGNVGLLISQSLILIGILQYAARQTAEVASQMTSVERIMQYTKLEKEGPIESDLAIKPHRDWPQTGKITLNNLTLTYVPNEAPVLVNLNIIIAAGEKVGIVGRTGAGKSSLIAALFRLAPTEGVIRIDDVDTKDIQLHELRCNISIIPQEPVLFSTTIKHNLDPLDKSDELSLWKALEDVELKGVITDLNQVVKEGGSNYSVGQRQLICLARAILGHNKILVMDEATANVDLRTDSLIQTTIRENFKHCTVLTIAHRLNTVMDSDKILVMDAGQAVEFGHPHELLQNCNGHLTKMVRETGKNMEDELRSTAKEYYDNVTSNNKFDKTGR